MAVDVSIAQEGLRQFAGLNRKLREQSEAVVADFQVSEERRLAGEAREARMAVEKKKLAEERSRLAEGKKELADQCNRLAEERDTLLAQLQSLKEQMKEKEEKLTSEREYSSQLEMRAADADSRLGESEKEAEALRLDLETAKRRGIEEYKNSVDFELEVAEGCMESFHLGFNLCKKVTAKTFPGLAVSRIEEPEDLEQWEADEEGTTAEDLNSPAAEVEGRTTDLTPALVEPAEGTSVGASSPTDVAPIISAVEVSAEVELPAEETEAERVEVVEE